MSINVVDQADNWVEVKHALISVSDKSGLESLVPQMITINPEIKMFSTGGTFNKIKEILGTEAEKHLIRVSAYTGQPETQGGLVKTLDFKIYLGLLTETYNADHQTDLERTQGVPIDMVIVNLYPFKETISKPGVTVEQARGNIDIGGPCMIRASAKNYLRVASVTDPSDYDKIVTEMLENNGKLSIQFRFGLACKAFQHTAQYDSTIAEYLNAADFDSVAMCYPKMS